MEFVDTNVLLYAISSDANELLKAQRAAELLAGGRPVALSAQVLQEFYWQATHPRRAHAISRQEALEFLRTLLELPVQDTTPDLILAAAQTSERFQISYWDAAIIEAARALGCDTVLTEDLSDGRDYGGIRVENPFRGL